MSRRSKGSGSDGAVHVVLLTMYYPPEVGAPQTRLAAITRALVAAGHTVEVVTGMPNYPTGRVFDGYRRTLGRTEVRDGVVVRRVWIYAAMGSGTKRLLSYLSFTATCVFGLVRCRRPKIVFIESPPLFTAVPGILAAKFWRALTVFNVADLWPDAAVELGALHPGPQLDAALALERWAYRKADVVNAVTDSVRAVLLDDKRIPEEKLVELPNGVDTELFSPGPAGTGAHHNALVYAGTVGFIHAAERLVEAMALLRDMPVRLVFYASGSGLEQLQTAARQADLDSIEFRDPVPLDELAPVLRDCLAGVVTLADVAMAEKTRPSKMFPVMASGRPVLFCGRGEGARIIADHRAGLVVDNDPEQIAKAVRELVGDPGAAERLGAAGRRFVEAELAWTTICRSWLDAVLPRIRK